MFQSIKLKYVINFFLNRTCKYFLWTMDFDFILKPFKNLNIWDNEIEELNLQFRNHSHITVPIDESMRTRDLQNEFLTPRLQLLIDIVLKYFHWKYYVILKRGNTYRYTCTGFCAKLTRIYTQESWTIMTSYSFFKEIDGHPFPKGGRSWTKWRIVPKMISEFGHSQKTVIIRSYVNPTHKTSKLVFTTDFSTNRDGRWIFLLRRQEYPLYRTL